MNRLIDPEECVRQAHPLGLDRAYHSIAGAGCGAGFGGPIWTPLVLGSACWIWLEGDQTAAGWDAGAPAETLATYYNLASKGNFTQSTKDYQPLASTQNGRKCPRWTATGNVTMMQNTGDLLDDAKCLHDGNGGTLIVVAYPANATTTQYIISGGIIGTGCYGMNIALTSASKVRVRVYNNTATPTFDLTSAADITSGRHVYAYRYQDGLSTEMKFSIDGVDYCTGNSAAAPGSNNVTTGIYLGSNSTRASPVLGEIPFVLGVSRYLTDAELMSAIGYAARF